MSQRPRIYLDHAATTPILPAAKAAMLDAMERWANPSSPHAEGRAARAALEDARARIKRALGWDGELIFTSGATEAIEIAMKRVKRERTLISPVEHDAVFRAAPKAELLPLAAAAAEPGLFHEALRGFPPALVAVQHINSETGYQPWPGFGASAVALTEIHANGGLLLCDCSQPKFGAVPAQGWVPEADFVVLSGHKVGGPPGIGLLLVRDLATLDASGGQESGYRGGTENLVGALGLAAALETAAHHPIEQAVIDATFEFEAFIQANGGQRLPGSDGFYSRGIFAVAMPQLSARVQLIKFDQMGFAVSAGSACSSGSLKPSRVLKAFDIPDEVAERTIRVSFGRTTTVEDIRAFEQAWLQVVDEAKARAA